MGDLLRPWAVHFPRWTIEPRHRDLALLGARDGQRQMCRSCTVPGRHPRGRPFTL